MRLILIRSVIIALALVISWLLAGRQLTLLLDRFISTRIASLPVAPLKYDGGGFLIGELPMTFGSTDNRRFDLQLHSDSANRVILSTGGFSFTLGPRTNPVDSSGRPEIEFVPDQGDELSFAVRRSFLSWPTPFEFNIMRRQSPWWKRYVYYRFIWKKRSGAKLEMLWRYEQRYYAIRGWTKPEMLWNSQTGLLRVDIDPETSAHENVVVQYIARTKGWNRHQYRIESRVPNAAGSSDVIAVIYLEDERGSHPGAGQSVELWVDRASHQVIKELGGQ